MKTRLCSAEELDCASQVTGDTGDCLDQCHGAITEVTKLASPLSEAVREMVRQYEQYKYPDYVNLTLPSSMKGELTGNTEYVFI